MQRFEVGIAGVQRVGVTAVGIEHQRAVSPGESAADDRPAVGACGNAVSPLRVVGQHAAGQGQQGFRGGIGVAVIDRFGHVVGDVDVQRAGGGIAVGIISDDDELFAEVVGTLAGRMGVVADQGVAVTDHAGGRVVAGDRQGVAQLCGDRLREADRHPTRDHIDPADTQAGQPVGRRHGEGAVLDQGARIAGRTIREVSFVEGQFAARHRQAREGDRVVRRVRNGNDTRAP